MHGMILKMIILTDPNIDLMVWFTRIPPTTTYPTSCTTLNVFQKLNFISSKRVPS